MRGLNATRRASELAGFEEARGECFAHACVELQQRLVKSVPSTTRQDIRPGDAEHHGEVIARGFLRLLLDAHHGAGNGLECGELFERLMDLGFPLGARVAAEPVELDDHKRVVGEGWKRVPTGAAGGIFTVVGTEGSCRRL